MGYWVTGTMGSSISSVYHRLQVTIVTGIIVTGRMGDKIWVTGRLGDRDNDIMGMGMI